MVVVVAGSWKRQCRRELRRGYSCLSRAALRRVLLWWVESNSSKNRATLYRTDTLKSRLLDSASDTTRQSVKQNHISITLSNDGHGKGTDIHHGKAVQKELEKAQVFPINSNQHSSTFAVCKNINRELSTESRKIRLSKRAQRQRNILFGEGSVLANAGGRSELADKG